jgi:hypothetical protein
VTQSRNINSVDQLTQSCGEVAGKRAEMGVGDSGERIVHFDQDGRTSVAIGLAVVAFMLGPVADAPKFLVKSTPEFEIGD